MEQPGLRSSDHLILTPDIEWCSTVRVQTREEIVAAPLGQPWTGEQAFNPFNEFGEFTRADRVWAGWLYASGVKMRLVRGS